MTKEPKRTQIMLGLPNELLEVVDASIADGYFGSRPHVFETALREMFYGREKKVALG